MATKKKSTLSENIMEYMMGQGFNRSQVGKLIGVTRSYCSYLAKGKRNFSADHMERLAEALDMTLPELLARSTPVETVPARLRENYKLLLQGLKASANLQSRFASHGKGKRKQPASA
jgi:transcriptional regulator with XRE-family HTH domain